MPGKRATSRVERAIMLLTVLKPDRMGAERARLLNKEQRRQKARITSAAASEAASPALKIPIPCPGTDGSPTPGPSGGPAVVSEEKDLGLCGLPSVARSPPSTGNRWSPDSENTGGHASSLDTNLTRNTRAPHFTPQHWLLCPMGLY